MKQTYAVIPLNYRHLGVLLALFVATLALPESALAGSGIKATSSFKAPQGCKNDRALAARLNAVQVCIERFTKTHEFVLSLQEKRYRTNAKSEDAARNSVKQIVKSYIADLRKTNAQAPGQTLKTFKSFDYLPTADFPKGAEFCSSANAVVFDRRVPGYIGEEFRTWMNTLVCARFDAATSTVQLVELRASERFRTATGGSLVIERFKYFEPLGAHQKAEDSLRLY